jgi:DNA-binding transcriptional LysR family regulator
MHITLRQLRIFEAVSRHTSISRAANELHLTQPAVSMQIKQLEEQIGLPLLEQIGKRLFLTEAGLELRAHAQRFAAQTHELKMAMDQFRGLQRGFLGLAVVSTANYFLPPLIALLSERHPGMRISLQVGNRESVLAALADNRTDLAITGQPPESADLVALPFKDNPLVVIAPPAHRFAKIDAIPIKHLSREIFVMREPGSGTRAVIERHFTERGVSYSPGCELSTNEAIKQAVQAGLGLGVVSRQTIEIELETRRLVVLPVEGFPIMRRWYVVHRKDKRLSAAAGAFIELLLAQNTDPLAPESRGPRAEAPPRAAAAVPAGARSRSRSSPGARARAPSPSDPNRSRPERRRH